MKFILNFTAGLLLVQITFGKVESISPRAAYYLDIVNTTRAAGLGNAISGELNYEGVNFKNPASISMLKTRSLELFHAPLFLDAHLNRISFFQPSHYGNFSFSLLYLAQGLQQVATAYGELTGEYFEPTATLVSLTYATRLFPKKDYFIGLSIVAFSETNYQDVTPGSVIDLGILYQNESLSYGAVLKNMGGKINGYLPPLKLSVGARYKLPFQRGLLMGSYDLPFAREPDEIRFGYEYLFKETVAFRVGYEWLLNNGSSFFDGIRCGLGVKYKDYWFDFAYGANLKFGSQLWFSLRLKL
jgi:hypothetical protein